MEELMDVELDAQIERELQDDAIANSLKYETQEEGEEGHQQDPKYENTKTDNGIKYEELGHEDTERNKMAEIEFEALPRPTALFLRGVDEMSTADIKNYCDSKDLVKVEWINDTSCNLAFKDKEKSHEVLQTLLKNPETLSGIDHKTLHPAKSFTNADGKTMDLFIRLSTDEDVKEKGARERSRYYLLHGIEDSEVSRERGRSQAVEERMKKNGGDGRDVFSRLGNKVALSSASLANRRQRDRSASPTRQETRQTREIPERLRNRLGGLAKQEEIEPQEKIEQQDDANVDADNNDVQFENGYNNNNDVKIEEDHNFGNNQ